MIQNDSIPANKQLKATEKLKKELGELKFNEPVSHVYCPFDYAWNAFKEYIIRFGNNEKKVVFVAMNPGRWGMTQTGIPLGEVETVKKWLKISDIEKRPPPSEFDDIYQVKGHSCEKSEDSGRRFWGLIKEKFNNEPEEFFKHNFVLNYCPLLFIEKTISKEGKKGVRNLPLVEIKNRESKRKLVKACDNYLSEIVKILNPSYIIGIGDFAEKRIKIVIKGNDRITIGKIIHPSKRVIKYDDIWKCVVTKQLKEMKLW